MRALEKPLTPEASIHTDINQQPHNSELDIAHRLGIESSLHHTEVHTHRAETLTKEASSVQHDAAAKTIEMKDDGQKKEEDEQADKLVRPHFHHQ